MLSWKVYVSDVNNKKIEVYDIFKCGSFTETVKKLKKQKLSKADFSEQLRKELMWRFWSRCEWEVVVTEFPPRIDKVELDRLNAEYEDGYEKYGHAPYTLCVNPEVGEKIDVYDQVRLNWNCFIDYVWAHRNEKF